MTFSLSEWCILAVFATFLDSYFKNGKHDVHRNVGNHL